MQLTDINGKHFPFSHTTRFCPSEPCSMCGLLFSVRSLPPEQFFLLSCPPHCKPTLPPLPPTLSTPTEPPAPPPAHRTPGTEPPTQKEKEMAPHPRETPDSHSSRRPSRST